MYYYINIINTTYDKLAAIYSADCQMYSDAANAAYNSEEYGFVKDYFLDNYWSEMERMIG